jgi:hypothetical protein
MAPGNGGFFLMDDLINYGSDYSSQFGEDGVIREIMRRLNIDLGFFVEFGAWDGRAFSNTLSLIMRGWHGVYIESDEEKYKDLLLHKAQFPDLAETICAFVEPTGENSLDNLLSKTSAPFDFDLLSIDIDSYDYQVWQSFKNYHPKVVVIECNGQVLPGVIQIHKPGFTLGASFTALVNLGKEKGYTPICHTGNLFFVVNELLDKIGLSQAQIDNPALLYNYAHYRMETGSP